jgi:hypothetical protein
LAGSWSPKHQNQKKKGKEKKEKKKKKNSLVRAELTQPPQPLASSNRVSLQYVLRAIILRYHSPGTAPQTSPQCPKLRSGGFSNAHYRRQEASPTVPSTRTAPGSASEKHLTLSGQVKAVDGCFSSVIMNQKLVFSEKLSKADALILKNLEADIKDASSRSSPANGHTVGRDNGYTKLKADGSTPAAPPVSVYLLRTFL